MNTSCTKPANDTPDPTIKTLEQTYPDWVNLRWESTDGLLLESTYPKLSITISGDVVRIVKKTSATRGIISEYSKMTVGSNTVTFSQVVEDYNGLGTTLTFTDVSNAPTPVEVTLTCLNNTYIFKK